MKLHKYLHQSDIKLYRGILNKLLREFDTLDPSTLSELLDKLKELHDNLNQIVLQNRTKEMYDTEYFKDLEKKKKEIEKSNNECIKSNSISLYEMGRGIWENKR